MSCPKPVHNHDLISPYSPSLCYQCERQWVEDVKTKAKSVKENTADTDKTEFLSLEGMDSPPTVRMAMVSSDDHSREHEHDNVNINEQDNYNNPVLTGMQPPVYDLETHLNYVAARTGGRNCNRNRRESIDSVDPVGHEIANSLFDDFTRINLEDIPSYAHPPRIEENTSGTELDLNEYEYLDLSPVSSLKDEPTDVYDFDLEDGQVSPHTKELDELDEITSNVTPSFRQIRNSFTRTFPPLFGFRSPVRRHWRD